MNLDNTNMKEVGIIDLIDQLSVIDRPKRSISHRPLYLSRLRKFQYSLPLPESLCQWRSPCVYPRIGPVKPARRISINGVDCRRLG